MTASSSSPIADSPQGSGARAPLVYVVILNYNGPDLTLSCADSVLKIHYPNFRVVVVDNASTDDSLARFREAFTDPRIEVLANGKNEGYAGGNDRGIELALARGAEYVFILNNDTIADPGCLAPLVDAMEADPHLGICGCQITDIGRESSPNLGHRISLYTGAVAGWHHAAPPAAPAAVDFVCGAAIMIRGRVARQLGGFDSKFFLFSEDADICFRARRAGHRACFIPGPGVRHWMGKTTGAPWARPLVGFFSLRNRAWLVRRHGRLRHRFVFGLFAFVYFYPKILLGRIVKGQFRLLRPLLTAVWHGHADSV